MNSLPNIQINGQQIRWWKQPGKKQSSFIISNPEPIILKRYIISTLSLVYKLYICIHIL